MAEKKFAVKKQWSEAERLALASKLASEFDEFINSLEKKRFAEGWSEDRWQEEMDKHPFFMKKAPQPGDEVHPMFEGLQKLKYDPEEKTPEELALNYKEDGNFYMKHKNFRIAVYSFTEGIKAKCDKPEVQAVLYNNRSAAHYFLKNYRSALSDALRALKYKTDYAKARWRAAQCAAHLNKYELCTQLCNEILEQDATHKEAKELMMRNAAQKVVFYFELEMASILDSDLDDFITSLQIKCYAEEWPEERWQEEIGKHPLFMEKTPQPGDEVHPMFEGLQKLKYDSEENTPEELALNYKEEGNFYMKHKHFRIAVYSFTEGIKAKCEKPEVQAVLYNNRSVAHYFLKNYRSALSDAQRALEYKKDYAKARWRAAQCAAFLNRYELCVQLCNEMLEQDATNKGAQELLVQSLCLRMALLSKLDSDMDEFINNLEKKRYEEKWTEERWQEEMAKHPFFMKKTPQPGDEVHRMFEELQKLKYDREEKKQEELALKYMEEANFLMMHDKFRLAMCGFTEGIKAKCEKPEVQAVLYNNRSAAHYFLKNYRSALSDAQRALEYKTDYAKARWRAAQCAAHLNNYELCTQLCNEILEQDATHKEAQELLKRNKARKLDLKRNKRREAAATKKQLTQFQNLCNALIARKVNFDDLRKDKSITAELLRPKLLPLEELTVHLAEDGKTFLWPAAFFYPEFQNCDFVQQLHEDVIMEDALAIIFAEPSQCNKERNYRLDNITLYYMNRKEESVHKVDLQKTLKDIISEKGFFVTGGSLVFYVLRTGSRMEQEHRLWYMVYPKNF